MTNSNRSSQVTLTSCVANVIGASMGRDSATDDWVTHGVSSCIKAFNATMHECRAIARGSIRSTVEAGGLRASAQLPTERLRQLEHDGKLSY